MRCTTDGSRLVEVDRAGILIDACPTCRGVWLDRGELDKILVKERQLSAGDPDDDFLREVEGRPSEPSRPPQQHDERSHKKRKRRSFLEELLDFD
jgi:Zn-finger nucleic acid-binding protein